MSSPIVSVDQITFRYSSFDDEEKKVNRPAIQNVSFDVYRGEWIAIVGHNGSGKSTLAKQLIGLLYPDEGTISLFGEVLTEENLWELRARLGIVFQNPDNQFVGSTVQDDVAFSLENQGVPYEKMRERVIESLKRVQMEQFLDHEPHHLSGGQKQRVAIAGAIALHPELLILDEATSMLDPQGRIEVIETVSRLRKDIDLTVMSITHDLEEVLLADRVIVMNGGEMLAVGTPEQIFSNQQQLEQIGLDLPFSLIVSKFLQREGVALEEQMTEEKLVETLWTSYFKE